MTEQEYLNSVAIYHPSGGKKAGKVYNVRNYLDEANLYNINTIGGGETGFKSDGSLEDISADSVKFDYSSGSPKFLFEVSADNRIRHSYNLSATTWEVENGTGNRTLNQVGITGTANKATLLEDTDTSDFYGVDIMSTINLASLGYYKISVWIKKDENESRFPEIFTSGGSQGIEHITQLNTKTGEVATRAGRYVGQALDRKDWWEVRHAITQTIDRVNFVRIRPAMSNTSLGSANSNAVGSCIIGHVEVSLTSNLTPIITNGLAVTRPSSFGRINTFSNYFEGKLIIGEATILSDSGSLIGVAATNDVNGTPRTQFRLTYNGEWAFYSRPSNTDTQTLNTGVTAKSIKFALWFDTSSSHKAWVNGVQVNHVDTGPNSDIDDTLDGMQISHHNASGNYQGYTSTKWESLKIYDGQYYTDQELIDITTV